MSRYDILIGKPLPLKEKKKAIKYLRKWLDKKNSATAQFMLTTNTIEFLDKYDKSVFLKEEQ